MRNSIIEYHKYIFLEKKEKMEVGAKDYTSQERKMGVCKNEALVLGCSVETTKRRLGIVKNLMYAMEKLNEEVLLEKANIQRTEVKTKNCVS